ncbi:hypothetical protein B0H17DRAFT_1193853 [Mycena rosella]|uniref:Uncharacterized protein n=1 Tax=Mycena rosella TaxID=1033263 RepID=A0AAD7GRV9_MYCRO|nr:hypothetical protein B0H17DRAFT_1193853 [Mycena rosella]
MASSRSLNEELCLVIFRPLSVMDILSLRLSYFRGRNAGEDPLDLRDTSAATDILPSYLKTPRLFDAGALEALVRRVDRLTRRWNANDLSPVNVWRLHLCQSITWLRFVSGRWLFVASSDNDVSKISCWDLSVIFRGGTEPIAEAYLPGPVKTARLEVQASGVVLAR